MFSVVGRRMVVVVTAAVLALPEGSARAAEFSRDILPILRRACVGCHGGEHAKGGLRLDGAVGLGEAITPGQASQSPLYLRLFGSPPVRMPKDAPALPDGDRELLRRWIDEGAPGRPAANHWAYQPPIRPEAPAVRDGRWVRNPLDRFVLARLERAGLRPAPPADRPTLLRRVTFDLTGLPPALDELDAFLADRRPDAYERVVDRLLASPHFGERWAVPWLDAARYADSNGYQRDSRRSQWPYRDWVVTALNQDMPFDQFTIEQLAGDLLPHPSDAQRIATGFHRNTMANEEGGVDPGEARWDRLVDRTATTATVWLASTLGCAQCHDHKHDPFTQRDFYRLLAYFEEPREATLPLGPDAARRQKLQAERAPLAARLTTWTPALGEEQRRWEDQLRARQARWVPLQPRSAASSGPARLTILDDRSVLVSGPRATPELHTVAYDGDLQGVTGVRLEALPDPHLPASGPGRADDGNFFLGAITLEDDAALPLTRIRADDRPTIEPERYAAETLTRPEDPEHGWAVSAVLDQGPRLPRQLIMIPARPLRGRQLRLRLRYRDGESIGRFRVSVTRDADPEASIALSPRLLQVVLQRQNTKLERDQLAQAYRGLAPSLAATRARLTVIDEELAAIEKASVLVLEPGAAKPRTRVRRSGGFFGEGEEVDSAPPSVLGHPVGGDRLALARWLTSRENPLAARVVVNRLWAGHFGHGPVETAEDFGTAGAEPADQPLLDWLASELVDGGWRQKRLHRMIVTSATYRQAASPVPERWVGRVRLDAEMVRDGALSAAGLLDERLGGPPVFPPQPDKVVALANATEPAWPESTGRDRRRRALYTFWRRTAPYPSAQIFDAGSREVCRVSRPRTNTPLQALVTMNDPAFWEAAQGLSARMRAGGASLGQRLALGFRLATARRPRPAELRVLAALYRHQKSLTLVANTMLNLDETLTRN